MSPNVRQWLNAPIWKLDVVESTNNYAMHLVDADKAQAGVTIIANTQTAGKGQRGNNWADTPGESLLMSLIATPAHALDQQFIFSAAMAVAVADVLTNIHNDWKVHIKWPNDIIINDKKAGGILIENVLRGKQWMFAVVGIGLNIRQNSFPAGFPLAISLWQASGTDFNTDELMSRIREGLVRHAAEPLPAHEIMDRYNDYLYRKNERQVFADESGEWEGIVRYVRPGGTLKVQLEDGNTRELRHGAIRWKWGLRS